MIEGIEISRHPIGFVLELAKAYEGDLTLSFSRYRYKPRSRVDKRESFEIPIEEVTAAWLNSQLYNLEVGVELALESRVRLNGVRRHIPMLDFRGMTKGQLIAIMEVLPRGFVEGVDVYFSGRSFHAYFPRLLTRGQWVKFMGSALLCNTPADPSVVDQRWVGHRLIGGYAALRWSKNSEHYKQYPVRVAPSLLNEPFHIKNEYLK